MLPWYLVICICLVCLKWIWVVWRLDRHFSQRKISYKSLKWIWSVFFSLADFLNNFYTLNNTEHLNNSMAFSRQTSDWKLILSKISKAYLLSSHKTKHKSITSNSHRTIINYDHAPQLIPLTSSRHTSDASLPLAHENNFSKHEIVLKTIEQKQQRTTDNNVIVLFLFYANPIEWCGGVCNWTMKEELDL